MENDILFFLWNQMKTNENEKVREITRLHKEGYVNVDDICSKLFITKDEYKRLIQDVPGNLFDVDVYIYINKLKNKTFDT